jgi:DNA adenine methylase
MRSPVIYVGSKGRIARLLLGFLPRHRCYVEVFGGGASLLFAKEPSQMEVYNDLCIGLVTFFRVLRDPEKNAELIRRLRLTPFSRKEWTDSRGWWRPHLKTKFEPGEKDIDKALRWYVVNRQSFSGHATAWGHEFKTGKNVDGWINAVEKLPEAAKRLRRVSIENKDFRWVFDRYDSKDTLFYCDPPYYPETWGAEKYGNAWDPYGYGMSSVDHQELVSLLLAVRGMTILSGYDHEVYHPLKDAGWLKLARQVHTTAAGVPRQTKNAGRFGATDIGKRTETIWLSPRLVKARKREDVEGE